MIDVHVAGTAGATFDEPNAPSAPAIFTDVKLDDPPGELPSANSICGGVVAVA